MLQTLTPRDKKESTGIGLTLINNSRRTRRLFLVAVRRREGNNKLFHLAKNVKADKACLSSTHSFASTCI